MEAEQPAEGLVRAVHEADGHAGCRSCSRSVKRRTIDVVEAVVRARPATAVVGCGLLERHSRQLSQLSSALRPLGNLLAAAEPEIGTAGQFASENRGRRSIGHLIDADIDVVIVHDALRVELPAAAIGTLVK